MRRGLAAVAASAAIVLSFGAPAAHAAPPNPPVVTEGRVSVAMSSGNTNPPLLSGHFHVDEPNATVTVQVSMTWIGPDPDHHSKFSPQNVCPGAQCTSDNNGNVDFSGVALQPALSNGPYHVDATATATDVFGNGEQTAKTNFPVAVPPPNVTGVTATVDSKTRQVTLSWNRDATTPDVQSYWIYRKGPGDPDFKPRLQTLQQGSGARLSVTDPATANAGGDYLYQLETHRNGATGDGGSFVASDRNAKESQSNKVTVASPPPGATTVPPPPSNGPPPVVKGTPSGVNRNSGFSSGSPAATTPTSEAVTPDPGFVHGLPDAGGSAPDDKSGTEGDNSAVAVTPGRHSSNGRGYLVPVAGAAVLVLGALHLRILKKRLDEPPGTGLTPV